MQSDGYIYTYKASTTLRATEGAWLVVRYSGTLQTYLTTYSCHMHHHYT
jgi:hypothetical protein